MQPLSTVNEVVAHISDEARGVVATHAAYASLCPFIPVPFIDDMVEARVRRRMIGRLLRLEGIEVSSDATRRLAARRRRVFSGALRGLLFWPVKRLLRKLLVILAAKAAADAAASMFHDGWLIARALEANYVDRARLRAEDGDALEVFRTAVAEAHAAVDPTVTRQVMKSAFGASGAFLGALLDRMKQVLSTGDDDARLAGAEREIRPLAERIEAAIRDHWSKGEALDAALKRALGKREKRPRVALVDAS